MNYNKAELCKDCKKPVGKGKSEALKYAEKALSHLIAGKNERDLKQVHHFLKRTIWALGKERKPWER